MRTIEQENLLISGNSPGSDQAFAMGANTVDAAAVELCLPWPSFERKAIIENPDHTYRKSCREYGVKKGNRLRYADDAVGDHIQLAARTCMTDFDNCRQGVQKLLIRNAMMLISDDGEIAELVIANPNTNKRGWGGTGHTIRIARLISIPVWLADQARWMNPNEKTR